MKALKALILILVLTLGINQIYAITTPIDTVKSNPTSIQESAFLKAFNSFIDTEDAHYFAPLLTDSIIVVVKDTVVNIKIVSKQEALDGIQNLIKAIPIAHYILYKGFTNDGIPCYLIKYNGFYESNTDRVEVNLSFLLNKAGLVTEIHLY